MPTFDRGTVVRVPFPYTDRPITQRRPALVVSDRLGDGDHLLWVVMITSAENRRWPSDIELIADHVQVGLPAPSLIRPAKIATIDADQAEALGRVGADVLARLDAILIRHLGLSGL